MVTTAHSPNPPGTLRAVLRREIEDACERPILTTLLALVFVSFVFVALPGLDMAVTRLFYVPSTGLFLDRSHPAVELVRDAGRLIERAFAVAVLLPLFLKLLLPAARMLLRPRQILFVLVSLALGPGLIVNGILKDHWGRARPRQIVDFGGDAAFSPAWWLSDACHRNCSFVSGEAASAFWLMAVVFLVPKEWRWPATLAVLAVATAVSIARLAAGGHFLSDVLIAWLIVLLVLLLTYRLTVERMPPAFDDAVEGAIARGGRSVRRLFGRLNRAL